MMHSLYTFYIFTTIFWQNTTSSLYSSNDKSRGGKSNKFQNISFPIDQKLNTKHTHTHTINSTFNFISTNDTHVE